MHLLSPTQRDDVLILLNYVFSHNYDQLIIHFIRNGGFPEQLLVLYNVNVWRLLGLWLECPIIHARMPASNETQEIIVVKLTCPSRLAKIFCAGDTACKLNPTSVTSGERNKTIKR